MKLSELRQGQVMVLMCIATCIAVATVYSTQPILAEIGGRYGVTSNCARVSFTVCSLAYALSFFVLGPVSDLVSARRLTGIGLLIGGGATLIAAASPSFCFFLIATALQGSALAAVPVAAFALIPRIAEKNQLGTCFGWVIAASVTGITVGRAGMGWLTASVGLGSAQALCGALLVGAAFSALFLPAEQPKVAFSATKIDAYINLLRLFGRPAMLRPFSTGFLLFFGYLGVVTFLTLRLQLAPFWLNTAAIGSISLMGLSAIVCAPLAGRLLRSTGPVVIGVAGLLSVIAAIALLAVAHSTLLVSISLFFIFFGVFICQPAVFVIISSRAPPQQRGASSSLYLLVCIGAGGVASAVLNPLWERFGWDGVVIACISMVTVALVIFLLDAHLQKFNERAAVSRA